MIENELLILKYTMADENNRSLESENEFTPLNVLRDKLGDPESKSNDSENKDSLKNITGNIMQDGKELVAIIVAFILAVNPWTIKFVINKVGNATSGDGSLESCLLNWKGIAAQTVIFAIFLALIKVAVTIDVI